MGVVAIVLAGLLLYDTNNEALEVSAPVVIVAGPARSAASWRSPPRRWSRRGGARCGPGGRSWWEPSAEVRQPLDPVGQVFVEGALWRAEAADGAGPIAARR